MKKIGLTGVLGSGKTTAAKQFFSYGIPVYIADEYAKEIMFNDLDVKKKLIDIMGESIYENNCLNKDFISNILFNNKNILLKVNKIIHPIVTENFEAWFKKQTSPYCIYESALIFENNSQNLFDKIVCIYTPLDIIYDRLISKRKYSTEKINLILANQIEQNVKCSRSDFCLKNKSINILKTQIYNLHKSFL
jgi:dephospho-CoA kinase|tara:strand:+ start:12329 stop:12904 length:576 start_codon:yes stop_codon:yes gene_type:complete